VEVEEKVWNWVVANITWVPGVRPPRPGVVVHPFACARRGRMPVCQRPGL